MILDDDSFAVIAAKHYDMNKAASVEEFYEDLKRFQYLKRLFKRYEEDNELRIRLILNHLIILYNCFGPMSTNFLFMKLEEYHTYLTPFILFLNYLPDSIEYKGQVIKTCDILMDPIIIQELRKI